MNDQLIKLIDLCLADGVISVKEREVIFRKAKSFGVDEDECEIILEGMIQKVKNVPIVTNLTPAKPKRAFTPRKVNLIKPAALDKEKELYKKVDSITEKEKKLITNYNEVLEELNISNDEINAIKTSLKVDFENFKNGFIKSKKSLNDKYIKTINQEISKKFGHTEMLLTTEQKTSFNNLALNEKKAFILENSKWNSLYINSKRRRKRNLLYLLGLLPIAYAIIEAEFDINDMKSGNWWLVVIGFFILGIGMNYNEKIEKNTMNFTDNDIKSVVDTANKSLNLAFRQLELKEELIKEYTKLSNHPISLFKTKQFIASSKQKKIVDIIKLLKRKDKYGH